MADNNFYPYSPEPSAGQEAAQYSEPDYPTTPPPQNSKKKIIIIIAATIIGLMLIVLAVALLVPAKKQTTKQTTQTAKVDPFALQDVKSDNIYIGDKQVSLSFQAPNNWHSQAITNFKVIYPWNNATPIVGFDFLASGLGQVVDITADNQMVLRDITQWLDIDQSSLSKSLTPANKKAQVQLLQSFSSNKTLSSDEIKKITNFQADSTNFESGGRQKPNSIISQDGSLHGVSYMTIYGNNYYDPRIVILLAGKINGQDVYMQGEFVVHDDQYKKLGTQEAAKNKNWQADTAKTIADFKTGNLADDTLKIYEEALNAVKSIKIENVEAK